MYKEMVNATASQGVLAQLYSNLVATGVQSTIVKYLDQEAQLTYALVPPAIQTWLGPNKTGSDATKAAIGLSPTDAIAGLRVQVFLADGTTAFDSNASTPLSTNNIYANIKVPASNFLTTGKYLINENQNTRVYAQSANLSSSGISYQIKYSTSTGSDQQYIAVRQGNTGEPLGIIVISINDAPSV